MEEKLYGAAVAGDARTLNQLHQKDPHILDKATLRCSDKTLLHIAVILGHVDFVKAILDISSGMCLARDRDGRNPLHLAAIKGKEDVLKAILDVSSDLCLARDKDGRNPLHLAAIEGKGDVLRILIRARPLAAQERTDAGETILHLCVKYNQLEALKILLEIIKDAEFLNTKNDEGMTILHLAVVDQQSETVRCLVDSNIDVNAMNAKSKTALDIAGNTNSNIESILQKSGALKAEDIPVKGSLWQDMKTEISLMVLPAVIAFVAVLSPPGGVWKSDAQGNLLPPPICRYRAGEAIISLYHPEYYRSYILANALIFFSSVSTILLLIIGLPLKRRFFVQYMKVMVWLIFVGFVLDFGIIIRITTPNDYWDKLTHVVDIVVRVSDIITRFVEIITRFL